MILSSTVDRNGFNYKFASKIINVSKGILIVMKGQKVAKNIYTLLGTTVVGAVAAAESELDSIVMLHMQWGHLGEHGMMKFYKRNLLKCIKTYKLDSYKYYVLRKQNNV